MSANYKVNANPRNPRSGYQAFHVAGSSPATTGYLNAANPAVPASTTPVTNNFGSIADVYITGGTVTAIAVNGNATGLTTGVVRVPTGATIALTYSVAPTWKWFIN